MSLPKLKPWHWALIALGLVLAAGVLLASRTELLGSFLSGDVAKNVRSEYAVRKSGVRLVSAPPQAPVGTSSASPTPTPSPTELQTLAASKGSLTIASATPTPAKADDETLDLTKPSDQLAPGGNQSHQGQRKELTDIPGRPRSSANFTAPAKGN